MWKSIFTFIRSIAGMGTSAAVAGNYFLRGTAEMARVFEIDKQSSALIGEMESDARLARKLKEIKSDKTFTEKELSEAKAARAAYLANRSLDRDVD